MGNVFVGASESTIVRAVAELFGQEEFLLLPSARTTCPAMPMAPASLENRKSNDAGSEWFVRPLFQRKLRLAKKWLERQCSWEKWGAKRPGRLLPLVRFYWAVLVARSEFRQNRNLHFFFANHLLANSPISGPLSCDPWMDVTRTSSRVKPRDG
jgi:hypothetical protein